MSVARGTIATLEFIFSGNEGKSDHATYSLRYSRGPEGDIVMFRKCEWLLVIGVCSLAVLAPSGSRAADNRITTENGSVAIEPIEHATFVMEWAGKTIAVDPVGGPEAFSGHPKADLVLITDIHGDHLSVETVNALRTDATTIIAPAAVVERFPEVDRPGLRALANGETAQWEGVTIEAVPMYNLDPEKQDFHPKGRGNGYVLTLDGTRIYIAGDTEDIPEMRALKAVDAAFVCMNLPYTMDVEAAAAAVLEFRPKVVFPYHYRGKGGMSDLKEFTRLVSANPWIEVRLLEWY
jgi:L-ascorbate metabolism protein UlaG (beta-lactamase superfamily)